MFKQCTRCGKIWETSKEFLSDVYLVCEHSEMGLAMFNCKCGTTLGIMPELVWPERKEEFINLWNSDPKYWLVRKIRNRQRAS